MSNRISLRDAEGNECEPFDTVEEAADSLARAFRGAESVDVLNNLLSMEVVEVEEPERGRNYRGQVISQALDLGLSVDLRNGRITLGGPTGWTMVLADAGAADLFIRGYAIGQADVLAHQRETRRDSEQVTAADCSCGERSWYGPYHDTACDFAGESRPAPLPRK